MEGREVECNLPDNVGFWKESAVSLQQSVLVTAARQVHQLREGDPGHSFIQTRMILRVKWAAVDNYDQEKINQCKLKLS